MGRGKRLIIIDCITEIGPIPGALWTFSTESKAKREEKHDFQFIETAVAEERDRENENSNPKQEDQMLKNKASTSGKRKVNYNSSDQHSTKKTKVDNVLKNNDEDEKQKEKRGSCMTSITMIQSTQKAMKNILKIFANF